MTVTSEGFDLGKRAGKAARNGDWSLVRHLSIDVKNESADYRADFREGYAMTYPTQTTTRQIAEAIEDREDTDDAKDNDNRSWRQDGYWFGGNYYLNDQDDDE